MYTYKDHSENLDFRLIHFRPMFYFYNPFGRLKNFGFLTFSGGLELEH